MTSGAVEHLRPSLQRRAKEVNGRAAGEKALAGDNGKQNARKSPGVVRAFYLFC